jgi:hypothetical protein
VGGAATAFRGLDEVQGKVSEQVHIPSQNYLWLLIGIWGVALLDAVLFGAGFFSTGRCREWCCRPPMTRRGSGKVKCSCRRCCRLTYPCLSTFVLFLLAVLVVASVAFAMAAAGFYLAKVRRDSVVGWRRWNGAESCLCLCVFGGCGGGGGLENSREGREWGGVGHTSDKPLPPAHALPHLDPCVPRAF